MGHSLEFLSDGYYGWEEAAPFDKIILTCDIDHIPPPLLQQLRTGGGRSGRAAGSATHPQGRQGCRPGGQIAVKRSDIYDGRTVPFVPFTKLDGDAIKGTH